MNLTNPDQLRPLAVRLPIASPAVAGCAALISLALIVWGDAESDRRLNIVILSVISVLVAATAMRIWLVWATVLASLFVVLGLYLIFPPSPIAEIPTLRRVLNRGLLGVALLSLGAVLHVFIHTYRRLDLSRSALAERQSELETANIELSAREEEVARQNEELHTQAAELERQGVELRLSNEQLASRERMLETLLGLSRRLGVGMSRAETMEMICRTLSELMEPTGSMAAIKERRGDQIHIVCHAGFGPEGPDPMSWAYNQSFAQLVLDRGRTGYLEDIDLRPDLRIPQPKSGKRLRAVLATPLLVSGKPVGSLEVFHTERHRWTEEQITLIESLAAQTSVSLEAAELFERLTEERARLKTVLDTVPFGVVITEDRELHVRLNPAAAAMLSVPPDTPVALSGLYGKWRVTRDGQPIGANDYPIARAARQGLVIANEELEFEFAGGRRMSVLASAAPLRGRDGSIVGAVSGWADVTQLKQLQRELDARRREAEESSIRKTRFLAAASHDIRNPTNAIGLLAELMQRTAANPSMVADIPEIAADLKRSALTLVSLVSDVLDITRFDSGKIDLHESEFLLREFIDQECSQYQQVAREKGLLFDCQPRPDEPKVLLRADRVKLSRVLSNLIGNAIKFTDTGGIRVVTSLCSAGAPRTSGDRQGSVDEGRGLDIRVIDTGPGIAIEHQARIFDEFFQLRRLERGGGDSPSGSGLGLAICRRLVEAMGGGIDVVSTVGEGSAFRVHLPESAIVRRG